MPRKSYILFVLSLGVAVGFGGVIDAQAVTVSQLQKSLAAGEKLTVIDTRTTAEFVRGHIPGAINVPASVCAQKHLPPLGKVIVYDAGLGLTQPDTSAAELAAKPGIKVDILEGGFAAWESAQSITTRSRGMKPEVLNYISYADLKAAKAYEVVLVDLRESRAAKANLSKIGTTNQPLTDLANEFPGLRQTHSPFAAKPAAQTAGGGSGAPPLLVLIDNGDGKAQAMAQKLKAQGVKRYVILTGGELTLARHGQRGLERNSPGNRRMAAAAAAASGGAAK